MGDTPPISDHLLGSGAGLATALLWVLTSLFFTAGGKRIGSTVVNTLRLAVAILLHAITFRLIAGAWWPESTDAQLLYLAISGILGLAFCDQALFTAFVEIGPRKSLLAMTTSPVWAALFGWMAMDERLSSLDLLGVTLTVAGVAWVIFERPHTEADDAPHPHETRGIFLALFAAVLQAAGLMLSKRGMGHDIVADEGAHISAQGATYIRLVFGAIGMLPIITIYALKRGSKGHADRRSRRTGRRSVGYALTVGGAVVGPYLGVWMSLVAVDHLPVGIAQTLCSLPPVFILPVLIFIYKEKISWRATLGALVAVGGSAMLVIRT